MPQMGESIAEGTVSKWLKRVGEAVERDEPILEISTDKVDAEIPAPAAGTLVEISVKEGETVEVGTVVAFIDTEAAPSANGGGPAPEEPAAAPAAEAPVPAAASGAAVPGTAAQSSSGGDSAEDRLRQRSTPVVRKIAEEHGVDLHGVPGTGHAGRVTKQDILGFIESGGDKAAPAPAPSASAPAARSAAPASAPSSGAPVPSGDFWKMFHSQAIHPEFPVREGDRVEPMDKIRRLTAEHMVVAKRIAPHVHSFIEIDFTAIDQVRAKKKKEWSDQGAKVSYTAFVAWACSRVLREFPMVNGTVSGNNLIFRGSVNIGIAVDLNPGLIVPVIHDAADLSLVGIGRKIIDLADRARDRKLEPREIQGATFSITNPGVLGTMVGMPVIPKGTSSILGTGSIEKRVVVITDPETGTDAMGIRKRCYFSLGYDHRIVDGADSARFLARLKEVLESFPEDA